MQVLISQSICWLVTAGISDETMRTYCAFPFTSRTLLTPATMLASIRPSLARKYSGFLQVTPLLGVRPMTMTLSTFLAPPNASNTHWIMGLPATSSRALDSPLEYKYNGSFG